MKGRGIYGIRTSLYFSGNSSFTANTATRGGGEYLTPNSLSYFSYYANLIFSSNNASEYGGTVYVEVSDPTTCTSYCFPDFDLDFETSGRRMCFFQATIIEGSYIDGENISTA